MPTGLRDTILALPSVQRLPGVLNAVPSAPVLRARRFRQAGAVSPAIAATARAKAAMTIQTARAKASARHTEGVKQALAKQALLLGGARARVLSTLRRTSSRTPAQVVEGFLNRSRSAQRRLSRSEMSVLLIESAKTSVDAFSNELATVLGLGSVAELHNSGIHVRRVLSARGDAKTVFAVRFAVKRSTAAMEIHNLAWALRKTGRFSSVRPDGALRMLFAAVPTHARRAERDFAWPLVLTRAIEAHTLAPRRTGKALGEGVIVAHPDTGWSHHPQYNEAQIDVAGSFNAASGATGGPAALHSVDIAQNDVLNLTHGTATGSVIVGGTAIGNPTSSLSNADLTFATNRLGGRDYHSSQRVTDPDGHLAGVAPRAMVRPIKFIDDVPADIDRTGLNGIGVVRFTDEDLVIALEHARTSGAHVVSLSIGGLMHEAVHEAIDRAVEDNLIVIAAAGQTYTGETIAKLNEAFASLRLGQGDTVVLPAAYANVIAVAGCSSNGRPWDESLRGPNVDITAPAESVWVADYHQTQSVTRGNRKERKPLVEAAAGTSFASAFMAGVAALWLGHWGRQELLGRYPGIPLAWVFRHQLQRTAHAVRGREWDRRAYGPGVVDVLALLEEPLPNPADVNPPPATVANLVTAGSELSSTPVGIAAGDAWAIVYDFVLHVRSAISDFERVAWAIARATSEQALAAGQQMLEDLHILADAAGDAAGQGTREAIVAVSAFIDAAAQAAADTAQVTAQAGDEAVHATEDFAQQTVDTVGEAAEDVVTWLLGWAG